MDKKEEYIVIISEGEKTEKQIIKNLQKNCTFLNKVVFLSYQANIYTLYKEIKDDEDIDIINLLKEKQIKANKIRKDIAAYTIPEFSRNDVSQIFLFFDYDGHTSNASNEDIGNMLTIFDNETENGKLYISYPMVEALKHLKNDNLDIDNYLIKIENAEKYKLFVSESTDYENLTTFKRKDWLLIIIENLKRCLKAFNLKNIDYEDYLDNVNQEMIFDNQLQSYILTESKVLVLSAFPFFLIEYIGKRFYDKLLKRIK